MNLPNAFADSVAITAMLVRVPDALVDTGMNTAGSNSPGIGIGTDNPNLQEVLDDSGNGSWSLLDQHGNARAAQIGQLLGGDGITVEADWPGSGGNEGTLPDATIRLWTNPANVDGQPDNDAPPVGLGNATLVDLAVGWTSV